MPIGLYKTGGSPKVGDRVSWNMTANNIKVGTVIRIDKNNKGFTVCVHFDDTIIGECSSFDPESLTLISLHKERYNDDNIKIENISEQDKYVEIGDIIEFTLDIGELQSDGSLAFTKRAVVKGLGKNAGEVVIKEDKTDKEMIKKSSELTLLYKGEARKEENSWGGGRKKRSKRRSNRRSNRRSKRSKSGRNKKYRRTSKK